MVHDVNVAVRMVDDWTVRCPGTVEGNELKQIAIQKERRKIKRLFGKKIKHIIYLLESMEELWYKNNDCSVGVVKMGFSLKRLAQHPYAVPMEFYYAVFTSPGNLIPLKLLYKGDTRTAKGLAMTGFDWLKLNDYEVI